MGTNGRCSLWKSLDWAAVPSNWQHSGLCLPFPLTYSQQDQLVRYASCPHSRCPLLIIHGSPATQLAPRLISFTLPRNQSPSQKECIPSLGTHFACGGLAAPPEASAVDEHLSLLFQSGKRGSRVSLTAAAPHIQLTDPCLSLTLSMRDS